MDRRKFIKNGLLFLAAPAIVKAENIMKISPIEKFYPVIEEHEIFDEFYNQMLRSIASSMQVPFDILTEDIGQTHYRSVSAYRLFFQTK